MLLTEFEARLRELGTAFAQRAMKFAGYNKEALDMGENASSHFTEMADRLEAFLKNETKPAKAQPSRDRPCDCFGCQQGRACQLAKAQPSQDQAQASGSSTFLRDGTRGFQFDHKPEWAEVGAIAPSRIAAPDGQWIVIEKGVAVVEMVTLSWRTRDKVSCAVTIRFYKET